MMGKVVRKEWQCHISEQMTLTVPEPPGKISADRLSELLICAVTTSLGEQ